MLGNVDEIKEDDGKERRTLIVSIYLITLQLGEDPETEGSGGQGPGGPERTGTWGPEPLKTANTEPVKPQTFGPHRKTTPSVRDAAPEHDVRHPCP